MLTDDRALATQVRRRAIGAVARPIHVAMLVMALCALSACGSILQHGTSLSTVIQEDQQTNSGPYHLQAGDQLEVHHILDPDYNALVVLSPDGRISIPGIPDQIQARGMTIAELNDQLNELYKRDHVLAKPFFSLNLRSVGSLQVFVGGEVQRPGYLEIAGGERHVLQVIASAGGFLATARVNEVILVRTDPTGKQQIFSVNMRKVIDGSDLTQNVRIRPLDVILVPKSDIAYLDTWIDQYIRQVVPFQTSASFVYTNSGNILH